MNIRNNNFKDNIGCSETAGVASIYCKSDQSSYIASTDTWFTPDDVTMAQQAEGLVSIESNQVTNNFAGTNRAVIEVQGFPKV